MCSGKVCALVCCGILVILAIMVPIGIFVIGPNMAQTMLDDTIITLTNVTLNQNEELTWADMYTKGTLHTPGPVGATIESYTATLTYVYELGYFDFPKMNVKVGNNNLDFRSNFTITNKSQVTVLSVETTLEPSKQFEIRITGKVRTWALGLLFHPKQDVTLYCHGLNSLGVIGISVTCQKDPFGNTTRPTEVEEAPSVAPSNVFLGHTLSLPDCDATACPSTCKCSEKACATELSDCLADPTCATLQGCVEGCKCGDDTCLVDCAMKTPSTKALAALKCIQANCPSEDSLPECKKTACPSTCQCSKKSCSSELSDCLEDATCVSLQGCVEACKCGDKACLVRCAMESQNTKALAALKCIEANCPNGADVVEFI